VFPLIRALPEDVAGLDRVDLRAAIAAMVAEHDDVGELLVRLRDLSGGYAVPPDGCASYIALYAGLRELEADTHLHVHKENNVLVPALTDFEPGTDGERSHPTHQELTR
jgi:regulator of cell morphogenesis and NO signaling